MNFQAMVDWGMISPEDLELFRIFDTVKEARDYIVDFLTREYLV
jgi:predicted Rossmann-fold nucleotide-binding protein